ncbi:MAG: hypothetical protein EBR82_07210 [Caulobacteraceae bacterium]|nr:hypothetical protein [Caulobacteraceae bacterium]
MNFVAPNRTQNVSIEVAEAWVKSKQALGLPFGQLCVEEVGGGAMEIYPIDQVPAGELAPGEKYYVHVQGPSGRLFVVASLIATEKIIGDPTTAFRSICDELDLDAESAMLNIPEVRKAIKRALTA